MPPLVVMVVVDSDCLPNGTLSGRKASNASVGPLQRQVRRLLVAIAIIR
jgi:hypothetical protein